MTSVDVDEYAKRRIPGLNPSAADLEAADSEILAKRIKLHWLRDGTLSIEAGPHIGVVNLDCASIRVVPKLVGSELGVLQMLDYVAGIDSLHDIGRLQELGTGLNLRDLVCLLLNRECGRLLRHGLRLDYVRHEEALPVVRGRLMVDRQVTRRFGLLDRLECRYDERSGDIDDNRLCAAALQLAARTAQAHHIRDEAHRLATDFATQCTTAGFDARAATERLTYHRANEHYRHAHRWARMLVGGTAFSDLYTGSGTAAPAFMINMNVLFEDFVTRLLYDALAGTDVRVRPQESLLRAIRTSSGHRYTTITPDIQLIRGQGATAWRCSIDAKYKLYADKRIGTADLFQNFVYAHVLSRSVDAVPPTAYILYASDRDRPHETITLHRQDGPTAHITAIAVNIPSCINSIAAGESPVLLAELRQMILNGAEFGNC
ncbi:hypothetical protein F8568_023540 [Actinomadura sp. LD22]|uniref:Restriction endonuclease n=1 Tax=Actinomadura physcomitrii TaxID=2650748 RepID=A0A6I4MH12_9ACTN|nr:hypothetical protein [Actinomadura physcomitrii]MWA03297.1 hypothetical protein [Actinomadura physcomitrii]